MTWPANDPWAAAAAPHATTAAQNDGQGGEGGGVQGSQSGLSGSYAAPAGTASQLFSGPTGNFYPALFNKTHEPGTTFSGTIISPPKDVQSTSFPRNPGDPRLPQYWCTDAQGKRAPGTDRVDPRTGQVNDPVMDLLVELQTDVRFDAATLAAIGRPADYVDEGKRAWQVSGSKFPKGHVAGQPTNGMRALLDALEAAVKAGVPITDDESMVGLKLTVKRVQRLQPGVSTSPWTYVAKLEK